MEKVDVPDVNSNGIINERATLYNPAFQRDNAHMYTILRTIFTNTTAWSILFRLSGKRNERVAYKF